MNRFTFAVLLQYENTRTFGKLRIIFNHRAVSNSAKNVSYQNVIFG